MYVMEVKPKRTWRGLRMAKNGSMNASVTTRHSATSHWFQPTTAATVLGQLQRIRQAGRALDLDEAHRRVVECACRAEQLR